MIPPFKVLFVVVVGPIYNTIQSIVCSNWNIYTIKKDWSNQTGFFLLLSNTFFPSDNNGVGVGVKFKFKVVNC